jgi:hypothetical protein
MPLCLSLQMASAVHQLGFALCCSSAGLCALLPAPCPSCTLHQLGFALCYQRLAPPAAACRSTSTLVVVVIGDQMASVVVVGEDEVGSGVLVVAVDGHHVFRV